MCLVQIVTKRLLKIYKPFHEYLMLFKSEESKPHTIPHTDCKAFVKNTQEPNYSTWIQIEAPCHLFVIIYLSAPSQSVLCNSTSLEVFVPGKWRKPPNILYDLNPSTRDSIYNMYNRYKLCISTIVVWLIIGYTVHVVFKSFFRSLCVLFRQ